MSAIADIVAREILDSRGNPTIEVDVVLDSGATGRAAVPSGASTARTRPSNCATTTRPATAARASCRRSPMSRAKSSMPSPAWTPTEQVKIDDIMIDLDGTANKARLGANAILGRVARRRESRRGGCGPAAVSLCRWRLCAHLPVPMMNIVNGGAHADNPIDIQEFMISRSAPAPGGWRAHGLGSVSRAEEGPARCRPQHQRRRRGRLRPEPEIAPTRRWASSQGQRESRLPARRGDHVRARSGVQRVLQGRQIRAGRRGQDARCRGMVDTTRPW